VRVPALDELLTAYRPVLHGHLVRFMGVDSHRADDWLQDFICSHLLQRDDLLQRADPAVGRFRTYLLTALRRFVLGQLRRQKARKRAPNSPEAVSLDENPNVAWHEADFTREFNVAWARHVLEQALRGMEQECRDKQRCDVWNVFDARVAQPALAGASPPSYEQLVTDHSIASPASARNLLVTAKRMLKRHLTAVIRDTVDSDEDVEREMAELRALLA